MAGTTRNEIGAAAPGGAKEPYLPGEVPMPDPIWDEDDSAAAREAAGIGDGAPWSRGESADDLTPAMLIGNHRRGKWVSRDGEDR